MGQGGLAHQSAAKEAESFGVKIKGYKINAMDLDDIKRVCKAILKDFGQVDILVNAVGGNMKDATTSEAQTFFDISKEALRGLS